MSQDTDKVEEVKEATEQEELQIPDDPSMLFFMGEVNEENATNAIAAMMMYNEALASTKDSNDDLQLYISTHGGEADEMFAMYDVMKYVQRNNDIVTIGIGKVMSAGVVLLAAGTKGKRKIGKNCRVMIHNVITGQMGAINTVEHEMKEVKRIQKAYIDALAENSNMTHTQIRKLMKRGENVYLSAEEAIKYGIADEIM
jgi:ATP-dependent Clp protease protease subunit